MPESLAQNAILIAGPTASGKSRAALAVARATGGEIVNADAIQVYRDLAILSARPGAEDLAVAPHHLFGFLDGAVRFSAGDWARRAASVVADIAARGHKAIVVGGTGLYFRALTDGLSRMPAVSAHTRDKAAGRFNEIGAAAFRDEVVSRDPPMARLAAGDTQRLLRAWSVFEETGEPLSAFQSAPGAPLIGPPLARIVIEPSRERLYAASDQRFDAMAANGGLDEAEALLARGLPADLPVMKALGAAELMAHLRGDATLEEAGDLARRNTRRFAKRQLTWFRNQAADWPRADDADAAAQALLGASG